ncbi:putative guanine aminohydrolase [Kockovaella imperatae]|uniref:Putative guanine aminohydrolase n=1 Tax=Kockovaella imperatae TaxID=4999 RepID=A0A1Y1UHZ3_9TREE|nr:putative guanine aminohydrolase [Kockovaella imperatae]ORX37106.1 putative guanine aminohydrolase [Kockovaella imperatae]
MQAFVGTLVDTPELGQVRIRRDHVLVVNEQGYITSIFPSSTDDDAATKALASIPEDRITRLNGAGESFLLPTFVDLHQHAPQYLFCGTGLDLPLLEWLDRYAYRAEESIDADPALAKQVYTRLAQRYKEVGTGCTVLFGTIKVESNMILAKAFQEAGVRAFVGKLSMDQSPRPTYNEASTAASLESVTSFLDQFDAFVSPLPSHHRLVQPIITPRFVPTCSDALLCGLAKIADERNVRVQSHLCEGRDQMDWVERTRGKKDEEVFDEAGLLRPGSIQAHVTYLSPSLMELCKARGVTVAHCPLSNVYFSEAQFPLREALDAQVSVGLGSDVAGGYSLSIETNMRSAVYTSRMREGARQEEHHQRRAIESTANTTEKSTVSLSRTAGKGLSVSWVESLYIGTRGGKKALGMGGAFEEGMEFDAQLITLRDETSPLGVDQLDFFLPPSEGSEDAWWLEAVERWWCNGTRVNRRGMWIQGDKVL